MRTFLVGLLLLCVAPFFVRAQDRASPAPEQFAEITEEIQLDPRLKKGTFQSRLVVAPLEEERLHHLGWSVRSDLSTVTTSLYGIGAGLRGNVGASDLNVYEIDFGYQASFLTAGDYRAHSIEGSIARTLSEWNGLQVQLGIQQVPTDVDLPTAARNEPFEQGWQDLRTYVFDLLLFFDVLTISTNRVEQHFRLHVGPSLKHRRGEQAHLLLRPKFIERYPETVEAHIEEGNYDYLYRQSLRAPGIEDGEYMLFSDDLHQWAGGGTFGVSYSLTYQRFSVGFEGLARIYSNKHKIYSYGLHLGYLL